MKSRFVIPAGLGVLLLLLAPGGAAGQTLLAETTWGGEGAEFIGDVATAADGSAYVVGTTDSYAVDEFGQPSPRVFIVKFAPDGSVVWHRSGTEHGHGRPAVAVGAANAVLVAIFSFDNNGGDALLQKVDAAGTLLWERTWGGPESDSANAGRDRRGRLCLHHRQGDELRRRIVRRQVRWRRQPLSGRKITDAAPRRDPVGADDSVYSRAPSFARNLRTSHPRGQADVSRPPHLSTHLFDRRSGGCARTHGCRVQRLHRDRTGSRSSPEGEQPRYRPADRQARSRRNLVFNRALAGASTADAVAIAPGDDRSVAGTTSSVGAGFQDAFVLHVDSAGKKALDAVTWGGAGFEEGWGVAVTGGSVVLAATTTTAPRSRSRSDSATLATPKSIGAPAAGAMPTARARRRSRPRYRDPERKPDLRRQLRGGRRADLR